MITPLIVPGAAPFGLTHGDVTFDVRHLYVRRYWTALIGPSAVGDLLRLVATARRSQRLLRPHGLRTLLRERLATRLDGDAVAVTERVQPLADRQIGRLPSWLRDGARSY